MILAACSAKVPITQRPDTHRSAVDFNTETVNDGGVEDKFVPFLGRITFSGALPQHITYSSVSVVTTDGTLLSTIPSIYFGAAVVETPELSTYPYRAYPAAATDGPRTAPERSGLSPFVRRMPNLTTKQVTP